MLAFAACSMACGRVGYDALAGASPGDGSVGGGIDAMPIEVPACGSTDGFCPPDCPVDTDTDCESVCGDGICVGNVGETCGTCAECATRDAACGNGECQAGESSAICPSDCGPSPWPEQWLARAQDLVVLINDARAAGFACPGGMRPAAPALAVDPGLRRASELWAWENSSGDYTVQVGLTCNGATFGELAAAAGTSAVAAMHGGNSAWTMASEPFDFFAQSAGACDSFMSPARTAIGVGHATRAFAWWNLMLR